MNRYLKKTEENNHWGSHMSTFIYDFGFGSFFITAVFLIIVGTILFMIIKGIATWSYNNSQPRITANAKVVTKRTDTRGGGETRAYSVYYVTFDLETGERKEFQVKNTEFGQLVEGDKGTVEYQGTRYHGFSRQGISHS